MAVSTYSIRPLDESTWPAFAALVLDGEHRWVVSTTVRSAAG